MNTMPLRQIHLDFHTSGKIPSIGKDFDASRFAKTLKDADVQSVTCFARCHHGYLYYPSKKYADRIHPSLECRDLLGEQIKACHEAGLRVPVYMPIQWDHLSAQKDPGYLVLDENGRQSGNGPYEPGFYRMLCLNTPYIDFVIDQALEVLEMYEVDGLFFDIINSRECSCQACKTEMVERGMDPSSSEQRRRFMNLLVERTCKRISAAMRAVQPEVSIYYNHSHVRVSHRDIIDSFTHLELESLPTGGWGYWDFPVTVRYARTLGVPTFGQTGKFHSAWGDFHSLKRLKSLEYECFRSLAFTSGCSIGDQLHPYGKLSEATYERIGKVYSSIKTKEPWCIGASPVVEIGVISPDSFEGSARGGISADIRGCTRMLTELSYQFDIIDQWADLDHYRLLILPDHVEATPVLEERLKEYLGKGGKVFSTFESGLKADGSFIQLPKSIVSKGMNDYEPDFLVPTTSIGRELKEPEYVMYDAGRNLETTDDALILAGCNAPFFNRTWEHFCSHMHAPSTGEYAYPGIVGTSDVIHASHPLFTTYDESDPEWYSLIVDDCLRSLLGTQLVTHDGPSWVTITLNEQPEKSRYIMHLLSYVAERRAQAYDTVHEAAVVDHLDLSVSVSSAPSAVMLVPQEKELEFSYSESRLEFTLPHLEGHQMVSIEFTGTGR